VREREIAKENESDNSYFEIAGMKITEKACHSAYSKLVSKSMNPYRNS